VRIPVLVRIHSSEVSIRCARSFTRALGGQSLRDNIRVVGVNPGPVQTERITKLMRENARSRFGDEERYPELLARFPLGRAAKPEEIADMMAFLASPRSAYTSGVIVTIDGGLCASVLRLGQDASGQAQPGLASPRDRWLRRAWVRERLEQPPA
jgi:hypothetical protein